MVKITSHELVLATVRFKMETWISSIENPTLANYVRDSYLVAGGCFASLFLGESPKDYDVWLLSPLVKNEVIKYYTEKSSNTLFKEYQHGKYAIKKSLDGESLVKSISTRAITLRNDIQIVTMDHPATPALITGDFDFTHNKCWMTAKAHRFPLDSLIAIQDKVLSYDKSNYPISALARVAKYIKKGFTISSNDLIKIANDIKTSNQQDFDNVIISSSGDVV